METNGFLIKGALDLPRIAEGHWSLQGVYYLDSSTSSKHVRILFREGASVDVVRSPSAVSARFLEEAPPLGNDARMADCGVLTSGRELTWIWMLQGDEGSAIGLALCFRSDMVAVVGLGGGLLVSKGWKNLKVASIEKV